MRFEPTDLPGVMLVEPSVFEDERGFFMEVYHRQHFLEAGLDLNLVQFNHSRSRLGTLRGLHYQIIHPQGKLVRAPRGEIFDVAVDLRKSSPAFGRWWGCVLSETNRRQVYIPPGFAHGFYVLSDSADLEYQCTELYDPRHERTILWNDPDLGIRWPVTTPPLVSPKDRSGLPFADAECFP